MRPCGRTASLGPAAGARLFRVCAHGRYCTFGVMAQKRFPAPDGGSAYGHGRLTRCSVDRALEGRSHATSRRAPGCRGSTRSSSSRAPRQPPRRSGSPSAPWSGASQASSSGPARTCPGAWSLRSRSGGNRRSAWRGRIRRRPTTDGLVVSTRGRFGFVAAGGTTDDFRIRDITQALPPRWADRLFEARDAGSNDQVVAEAPKRLVSGIEAAGDEVLRIQRGCWPHCLEVAKRLVVEAAVPLREPVRVLCSAIGRRRRR